MIAPSARSSAYNPFIEMDQNLHTVKTLGNEGRSIDNQSQQLQQTQRSNMDKILCDNESMQNQLSLTSKIKQSLESELV